MTDTWDPRQYDKFEREREQPFYDLLALVHPKAGMRAIDLGCGTGKLTRVLHERLDARETLGLDRSESMLAAALASAASGSRATVGLRFDIGTIESFVAEALVTESAPEVARRLPSDGWDLIFSNAALHWVDDHDRLVEQLSAKLAPAGQLAFQVPAQHDTLTHLLAEELAAEEPFRAGFGGWRRAQPVLTPDSYARLLYRCGFRAPKAQLIVYPHVLASREDVVEWVKGTMLTEYKRHLPEAVYDQFVAAYRARLLERLDDSRPFFYPFKRILCWGQRSA